jgi:hypothetical protein
MSKRCGKIWEKLDVVESIFLYKENMENVWATGVMTKPEKRDTLGIDYAKLREVIRMENQTRVPSLVELAMVKFCGWTMEIDRKDLHWMMVNRIPEQLLKRIEEYRSWLDQKPTTTKVEMLWKFGYSLQWMVPPYEIVPREFYAIEKGLAKGWNQKSREEVGEIRKRELNKSVEEEQRKKQRKENRSGDRISK